MDKILTRILCYRKLFSLHHHLNHHRCLQCIKFQQTESLQEVIPGRNMFLPRCCHDDAASKSSMQDKRELKRNEGAVGGELGDGTEEGGSRILESTPSVGNQESILVILGNASNKPTGSSPVQEDPSSSSSTDNSISSGGKSKTAADASESTRSSSSLEDNSSSNSSDNSKSSSISKDESLSDPSQKTVARDDAKGPPVPPDPETCCESGCVNCVWIKYAEEVKEYYPDKADCQDKLKDILDLIEDYNVKMFVRMELGIKR